MSDLLQRSKEIYDQAVADFQPYATVAMFSAGDDSLTVLAVAKALGIKIDFVLHGVTGTGIRETTEHARQVGPEYGRYIEADAGDAYERYVLHKGFFGTGRTAHTYAYHTLKATSFRKAVSRHIRQRKRGRNVLLLNGARLDESGNRKHNLTEIFNRDPAATGNIWVNLIHHWPKAACRDFLRDSGVERNPVAKVLCRSGECLCGTMQSKEDAAEATYWFPAWGEWYDSIRRRVAERGFSWTWGENMPRSVAQIHAGQMVLPFPDFQPACVSCKLRAPEEEQP